MSLANEARDFIDYLETWLDERPTIRLDDAIPDPETSAIISIDVINAFLYEGPLSSPRVAKIGEPIANLMESAWDRGLHNILLVQEGHQEDSLEFDAFGQHAIKGTPAAEAVDWIKELPFYEQLTTVYKDSIHPAINNDFDQWLDSRMPLRTYIAVGDVTDLCVYHLATYLRFRANAYHQESRVIVPANCVQTWHTSLEKAKELSVMPHHGDMLHHTFLYHMALNGIEVVKEITD